MTRKEEIRNASVAYNEKAGKLLVMGGDSILSEEEYLEFNKNPSFIAGAEWADRTMLDKVWEWLKEHMHFTEGIANGEVYYQCNSMESFLNDLKQAMEE